MGHLSGIIDAKKSTDKSKSNFNFLALYFILLKIFLAKKFFLNHLVQK